MQLELIGVFGAGLLTFVTPCVLPLIPIYLAVLLGGDGGEGEGQGRLALFLRTLWFVLGMMLVFVTLGLTATSLGMLLTEYRGDLVLAGGLMIFLFGLKFLGVLKISWLEREARMDDRKLSLRFGWLNALVMGVVFSLGWTPCVGPILGSVLTYTASTASSTLEGALYLGLYGAGFTLPLLVMSLLGDSARVLLKRVMPWLQRIERLSGWLLVAVGLFLIFDLSRPPAAAMSPPPTDRAAAPATSVTPPLGSPTERPRMVQFASKDCSVCRQMIPTMAVIERECGGQKVDVVQVDISEPANHALARQMKVRGVPTFVFYNRDGTTAARLVGYQTLSGLRQALSVVVGQECDGLGYFNPGEDSCAETSGTGANCAQ